MVTLVEVVWRLICLVFCLLLRSLHHTVEIVLRRSHRESLLGKDWSLIQALLHQLIFSIRFNHLLDLVGNIRLEATRINHRQSNH